MPFRLVTDYNSSKFGESGEEFTPSARPNSSKPSAEANNLLSMQNIVAGQKSKMLNL